VGILLTFPNDFTAAYCLELGQDPLPAEAEARPQVARLGSACGRKWILWTLGAACKVPTYLRVDGNFHWCFL